MKTMADYVHSEQAIYENILENKQTILQEVLKMDQAELSNYEAVVIFATGSSSNAAFAAQPYMAKFLQMPVFIEEPSYDANYMLYLRPDTLYLAISQSGHSYSTIHMVEEVERQGGTVFTLTSDFDSPIAKTAKHLIGMGMEIEEMPYVTAGYSATILIVMLLSLEIAKISQKISVTDYEQQIAEIAKIPAILPNVIKQSEVWIEKNQAEFLTAERMIFIGYGATYGLAREGETKVTETIRITAFGKELEEYMHGPYIGLMNEDRIMFIEPHGKLAERAEKLKQFLEPHVSKVYTIYANQPPESGNERDLAFGIQTDELLTALFMTVPIHLLAYEISKQKGINLEISAYPEFDQITGSKI